MFVKRLRYIVPLCVIGVALVALFSFTLDATTKTRNRIIETGRLLNHTHEVGEALRDLTLHIKSAEAQQRGYLITPSPDLLAAYRQSCRSAVSDALHVRTLTSDNRRQQARLRVLAPLIAARIEQMDSEIMADRNLGPGKVIRMNAHPDKQVDSIILAMRNEEFGLLQKRTVAAQEAIQSTETRVTAALWLVILIICASTATAAFHLHRRSRTEAYLKRANDALRRERESLDAITTFLSEVVNARFDISDIMSLVAGRTQELTGATGAVIELVEDDEIVYRTTTGDLADAIGTRLKLQGSLSGEAVRTGKILRSDDIETDERVDKETCRRLGIRSMVNVPLVMDGVNAGVIKVTSTMPNAFDDHALEILEPMASIISTAMSRAAQFQAIEALLRERTDAVGSLERAQSELKLQLRNVEDLNVVLQFQQEELQKVNTQLEALATTDGLTGLKNHRAFQEQLREEYQRAVRYGIPLSIVLLDVDHFKQFNDTFGHPAGDAVLNRVARILEGVIRECDMAARYGGEEFVFVLPQTDGEAAKVVAERCRKQIESAIWDKRPITASFGVASMSAATVDSADLIEQADAALYAAKIQGRNRVAVPPVEGGARKHILT